MSKKKKRSRKPRNPLTLNPLMKKSHVHKKGKQAQRARAKQELQKEIEHG